MNMEKVTIVSFLLAIALAGVLMLLGMTGGYFVPEAPFLIIP